MKVASSKYTPEQSRRSSGLRGSAGCFDASVEKKNVKILPVFLALPSNAETG